jgi:hypothetical protein
MNAQTKILPTGEALVPSEAFAALGLPVGATLSVEPDAHGVYLRAAKASADGVAATTWDDLMAFPAYSGLPRTVEDISTVGLDWLRERYGRDHARG